MGLAVRKSIIDEYDEETRARIMDLAMTLGFIDQGLVRVIPGPFFSSDYDIPVKALKDLNEKFTFMLVILSNHPFERADKLVKPLDSLVTRGDFDALNDPDAVLRTMQAAPFFFKRNEKHGVYFSDTTFETVKSDHMGEAILARAQGWRSRNSKP